MRGVTFGTDNKFDLQLSQALIDERQLAAILAGLKIERIELKSETFLWERTGNLCIEYRHNGRPSGISVTEADCWAHELKRLDPDGAAYTLGYWLAPIGRLKDMARAAIDRGAVRKNCGDDGKSDVALISLRRDIFR